MSLSSTLLGSGHYGIVREGRWNDVAVAVKVLRPCQLMGDFLREANAMHQLSHPSLLRLYGIVLSEPLMLVEHLSFSLLCSVSECSLLLR